MGKIGILRELHKVKDNRIFQNSDCCEEMQMY